MGVEAVHAFNGGWDTHATQGPLADLDGGFMHNKMLDLSRALAAFHADVIQGNAASGVTVVIISSSAAMPARMAHAARITVVAMWPSPWDARSPVGVC